MKLRLLSFFTAVMALIACGILTGCPNDISTTTTVAPEPQIEIDTATTNKSVSGISKNKTISSSFGGSTYNIDLDAATATFTATKATAQMSVLVISRSDTAVAAELPDSFSGTFFYVSGTDNSTDSGIGKLWLKADVPSASASASSFVLSAAVAEADLESDSEEPLTPTFSVPTEEEYKSAKQTFTEKAQETIKTEIDKIESSIKDAQYSFKVSGVTGNNNAINVEITAYSKTFTVTIELQEMKITMGDDTPSWFKVLYAYLTSSGILNELTNLMSNNTSGNSTTNNTMSKYPNITAFLTQMITDIMAYFSGSGSGSGESSGFLSAEEKALLDAAKADIAKINDLTNDITVSEDGRCFAIKMGGKDYEFEMKPDSDNNLIIDATGDTTQTLDWIPKLFDLFMGSTESGSGTSTDDANKMMAIYSNYREVVELWIVLESKMSLGDSGSEIQPGDGGSSGLTSDEKTLFSTANEQLTEANVDIENDTIFTVKAEPTETTGGITLTLTVKLNDVSYDFTATVTTGSESFPTFTAADSTNTLDWLLKFIEIYAACEDNNTSVKFKMMEIEENYKKVSAFGHALIGYVSTLNNIESSGDFLTEDELKLFEEANKQLANVDLTSDYSDPDKIFTVKLEMIGTETEESDTASEMVLTLTLAVTLSEETYNFYATVTDSKSFPEFTAAAEDSDKKLEWLLPLLNIYAAIESDPRAAFKIKEIESKYPKVAEFGKIVSSRIFVEISNSSSGLTDEEKTLFADAATQLQNIDLTGDNIYKIFAVNTDSTDTTGAMTLTLTVTLNDASYDFTATVTGSDSDSYPVFKPTNSSNTPDWLAAFFEMMNEPYKMMEVMNSYPKVGEFCQALGKYLSEKIILEETE